MTTTTKPNAAYWIIAVIALLWNGWGVMSYLSSVYPTEESRALYSAEQLALLDSTPAWLTGVFATAVFSGLLGCLCLLIRKKWAVLFFGISLITVLIQMLYNWLATDAIEIWGTVMGVVLPMVVIVVAIFLYFYSKGAAQKGWLR